MARQTGRFKDQTFQQLDRIIQNKVVEVMLDSSIKNRKGVLAYGKKPSMQDVLKLAPWWPHAVAYAPPRSMPQEDLAKVFAAVLKHADASDELLLKKLEASVGSLGVDTMIQLAILASMRALTKRDLPAVHTPEEETGRA